MQLVVGRIGRPHGVRGEVSVDVRTDDPGARFAPGSSLVTDPERLGPLTIETVRMHSGRLLVRFAGFADRTAAEDLRGTWLVIDSAEISPSEDPEEFHDQELIGLRVVTVGGEDVGEVTDVQHFGQDRLVVRRPSADDVLIPFVVAIVPEVDIAGGKIVIDPPDGLL